MSVLSATDDDLSDEDVLTSAEADNPVPEVVRAEINAQLDRYEADLRAALEEKFPEAAQDEAEFKESEHPRDKDGKFTSGGGGESGKAKIGGGKIRGEEKNETGRIAISPYNQENGWSWDFGYQIREQIKAEGLKPSALKTEKVRISDLSASQYEIQSSPAEERGVEVLGKGWGRHPVVARSPDGVLTLLDGHHRADAAAGRGQETLDAWVFDVSATKKEEAPAGKKTPQPSDRYKYAFGSKELHVPSENAEQHSAKTHKITTSPAQKNSTYRGLVKQIIDEAGKFGHADFVDALKGKIVESFEKQARALREAGKNAEADKLDKKVAQLRGESGKVPEKESAPPVVPEQGAGAPLRRLPLEKKLSPLEKRWKWNDNAALVAKARRERTKAQTPWTDAPLTQQRTHEIGVDVASSLGYDPDLVSATTQEEKFHLNGKTYDYAGACTLSTGKVVLYATQVTEQTAAGVAAHEVMHGKFAAVAGMYAEELRELSRHAQETGLGGLGNVYTLQGELKTDDLRKKFPVVNAFTTLLGSTNALSMQDGVTQYSGEYWTGWEKGEIDSNTAIHETLAEMAMIEQETGKVVGSPLWQAAYKEINRLYATRKKKQGS